MTATALAGMIGKSRAGTSTVALGGAGSASSSLVPAEEQWLYKAKNKVALKMVRDGIADEKAGRFVDLGSFAQFATDDDDE